VEGSLWLPAGGFGVVVQDHCDIFERQRRKLHSLAYRLLGSVADAEDVIQDLYLRWHATELAELRSPEAWLTTVLTRSCIDRLRIRDRERATYLGHWLPEPILIADPSTPDRGLDLDADLSMALLLMLERLTPDERTVFLLHDVFGHRHHDIASILGKAEPKCRQLLHRARMSIRVARPRFNVNDDQFKRLVPRFLDALRSEDHASLMNLMSEDATLISDSGGRVRATLKDIQGNDRIARLLTGLRRNQTGRTIERLMLVNLDLGIATYVDERPVAVLWVEIERWKIIRIYRILNPDKLQRMPSLPLEDESPRPVFGLSVALTGSGSNENGR
jgi:RNA polymerase sigma-70 factor, ECF subfamily